MKSLLTLLQQVLDDVGGYCSVNTTRDFKTISSRFENEGMPFLTVSLPRYAAGLEKALASGKCSPDLFSLFKSRQSTPILLGGFMDLIFDRASGLLLDDPSIEAIRSLRQVCLLYKKIELPCTPEVTQAAFDKFVKCDAEVGEWEQDLKVSSPEKLLTFHKMAQLLFSRVFLAADREIRDWKMKPKHGPGATADKLVANQKFEQPEWTWRLESVAPYWKCSTTVDYSQETYDRVIFREPGTERPVRAIDVPKTLETPRIIAVEPTCMQYVQQGIMAVLKRYVDSSFLEQLIGTTYQEPNQLLAMEGSLSGDLATLDLSEASDRVSNLLVGALFYGFPHLSDAVQASRSSTVDVPGHGVLPLSRFASMGSALCFPVETMVFMTCVFLGLQDAYQIRFTNLDDVRRWVGRVRAYGDDIICPVDAVSSVIASLESFGFKVNQSKSFWTGKFRESCGAEFYDGEDVTLCRVRRELPTDRNAADQLISAVSFRNQAYGRGLWKTVRWLDEYLEGIIPFPAVAETSSVLGKHSFLGYETQKQCPALHRPMVWGATVRYRRRFSPIDGSAALMKSIGFQEGIQDPYGPWNQLVSDADHLVYAGRPEAASIKLRMAYSY